jgi:glycosyltransferase involved in cell wall biosynthesis
VRRHPGLRRSPAARASCPGDDGWVDAIRTLLTDDAARGRLVAAGAERVGRYSWARCARETVAVYREALSG